MCYLVRNKNLAAILERKSPAQAGPRCHAMMVTGIKKHNPERDLSKLIYHSYGCNIKPGTKLEKLTWQLWKREQHWQLLLTWHQLIGQLRLHAPGGGGLPAAIIFSTLRPTVFQNIGFLKTPDPNWNNTEELSGAHTSEFFLLLTQPAVSFPVLVFQGFYISCYFPCVP